MLCVSNSTYGHWAGQQGAIFSTQILISSFRRYTCDWGMVLLLLLCCALRCGHSVERGGGNTFVSGTLFYISYSQNYWMDPPKKWDLRPLDSLQSARPMHAFAVWVGAKVMMLQLIYFLGSSHRICPVHHRRLRRVSWMLWSAAKSEVCIVLAEMCHHRDVPQWMAGWQLKLAMTKVDNLIIHNFVFIKALWSRNIRRICVPQECS